MAPGFTRRSQTSATLIASRLPPLTNKKPEAATTPPIRPGSSEGVHGEAQHSPTSKSPDSGEPAPFAAARRRVQSEGDLTKGYGKSAYDPDGPVTTKTLKDDTEFWEPWLDIRTLGRGHFAKVKEVQHFETKEHYAVKILDKTSLEHNIEDMVREFQILRCLKHPNIIRLYGAYESPRKLYLVTELASGGQLMKRLGDSSKVYSEDAVRVHVKTLLDAVSYMHEKNCVHRDLKPENVLLSDMSDSAIIKIVDLGLSRFFDEAKPMRTICGTHKFLAPELVQTDRGQVAGYDKAIDMWGVGLLAFIMLNGFNPFARKSHPETHDAILQAIWEFPEGSNISDVSKDFVHTLLKAAPSERLTARQALQHVWIMTPSSPLAILSSDKPVKQKLVEFNATRMISRMVKGPHRRLSHSEKPLPSLP